MNELTTTIVFILLGASFFLSLYRLLRGPTQEDRILALDFFSVAGLGLLAFISLLLETSYLLDLGLLLALIGFATALALSRNLWRKPL